MKWQSTRPYLRRLLGPVIDIGAYCASIGLGASSARSQLAGFAAAAAFCYLPSVLARGPGDRAPDPFVHVHLLAVTLLAFFLRSGVFAMLTGGWGWPGPAAIAATALATLAVVRPGYAYCVSYPRWRLGSGDGWRAGAVGVVVFAAALRLIYSGRVELMPEETYYWNYARHLDFGYLDHPPMVGWLIGAGTALFGDTEFGVRSGALCCGAVGSWFAFRLTRNLFGEPSGLVALVLMQALPFFFLSGMLMTPDAPLTAAWSATLYFLERALIAARREAWWGVGLCFGLGLLSKYTIGLLGISTLIFMLLDRNSRPWLRRWEPYGAALLALAIFSPVIVWNARNEWASFVFQTSRRLADRPGFALHRLIASALVLLTPTGLAAAGSLLAGRNPQVDGRGEPVAQQRAWRFLQLSILVPLAVFAAFSLRHEVKLDWTGAPCAAVVPALAFGIVHYGQSALAGPRAWIRSAWTPTILILLLIYAAGLYDLALGIPGLGYGKHAELVPVGWRELGGQIDGIAEKIGKADGREPLIVGMDRYAIASELAFYGPDRARSVAPSATPSTP